MAISIHHGPPGSYKTSGAIQDNFIPAAKAGRLIITNVRGLDNPDIVVAQIKNIPDTFNIINIDTSTTEGREKLANWFHWAPKGAYLLIDEINTIYPTDIRDSQLTQYDYPGGLDQAKADDRPATVKQAFEMHRHYNWDFCVTTPHINKVHTVIRQCSETAFRHKNQATIGLKGWYLEIFHAADDTGKNPSTHLGLRQRRVKKHVFKLYSSTTTGQVQDTTAGRNILLQPQVLFFLFALIGSIIFLYNTGAPSVFSEKQASVSDVQNDAPSGQNIDNNNTANNNNQINSARTHVDFLKDYEVYFVGSHQFGKSRDFLFQLKNESGTTTVQDKWLKALGYEILRFGECLVRLTINGSARIVTCPLQKQDGQQARFNPTEQIGI